ncbi:YqjF family protein [Peribacillus glennii]|uniref:DUF2071 domain-containing protein n=1 Tax=Peribacillus glennii TaxID=2303991 RepID=A0A372LHB7_9BACI|nr:DUF2071 domain-containing protein [Peribacillus glennii]RFU65342.1 DUF2071 domain-containing protein [Peribacillus glennii]
MYKEFWEIDHRPYPLPGAPWVMTQVWRDLLFMHYPLAPESVGKYLPGELMLDTFEHKAWVSIIPLRITNMRMRGIPPIPFLHSYLELNVRTYVIHDGIPGIYFFSLDADHPLAVAGASAGTGLPYKRAKMLFHEEGETIKFKSERMTGRGNRESLDVAYSAGKTLYEAEPGSLDHWLMERYCMYSFHGGNMLRGDIHHDKWKVRKATADISYNRMAPYLLSEVSNTPPILHYSSRRRFFFYPLVKVL